MAERGRGWLFSKTEATTSSRANAYSSVEEDKHASVLLWVEPASVRCKYNVSNGASRLLDM